MTELERLEAEWNAESRGKKRDWNAAADSWERKYRQGGSREASSLERLNATVSFLEERGILTETARILDAGCGPGRFAAAFAERCGQVTGVDISEKMCAYGEAWCAERGLDNVRFITADFAKTDIAELGLEGQFDLAFSSITPAVRGLRGLDNLIRASRQWCFNASFVREDNRMLNRVRQEVFGLEPAAGRGMHADWFWLMFRILWLRGYDPEVRYYDQSRRIVQSAEGDYARVLAEFSLGSDGTGAEEEDMVRRFLERIADPDGNVTEVSEYRTAWL
ncbi:MAG: methyltransferase domain-containing protein, partial [Oscillospiraceae bacterium]|nr:methyltransferase domain-containing protein [Oscillospiraceae bacterium]